MRQLLFACVALTLGCATPPAESDVFPLEPHELLPEFEGQRATGPTSDPLIQPIAFPHDRHVGKDGLDCQFCHSEARKSIHAGVPPTQTCLNCHKWVMTTESEEIAKVLAFCGYDVHDKKDLSALRAVDSECPSDEPIPWQKVHDLPDYVYFSHKRHVRAGVDCTECHGQVGLMSGERIDPDANDHHASAEHDAPAEHGEAAAASGDFPAQNTMIREATLQMGWCLECHRSHPSVDENYGEAANIRRAELKDCWTCHK